METELGANFQSGYTDILVYSAGMAAGATLVVLAIAFALHLFVKRRFAVNGRTVKPFWIFALVILVAVPAYSYFTLTIPPRPVIHAMSIEDQRDLTLNRGAEFFGELCAQGFIGIEPRFYGVTYGEGTCENGNWLVSSVLARPPVTSQQEIESCVVGYGRTSGIARWGASAVRSCLRGEME